MQDVMAKCMVRTLGIIGVAELPWLWVDSGVRSCVHVRAVLYSWSAEAFHFGDHSLYSGAMHAIIKPIRNISISFFSIKLCSQIETQIARHGFSPIWASYQIRKIAGCACAGNAGNGFSVTDFKGNPLLAIPACIMARASCTFRDACRDC